MRIIGKAAPSAKPRRLNGKPGKWLRSTPSFLCVALLAGLPVTASQARAQTSLAQAVLMATEFDPGLTALRQEIARKGVDIESARDEGRPQFGISAETATTDRDGPALVLTVSQVLYDWGQVKAKVGSATQNRVIAVADLKKGAERLTRDVADYFIDIEEYDQKITVTTDYLAFAERIAGHARARAEAGRSDRGESARANLEVVRTLDQLAELAGDRDLAVAQLEFLMGRDPGALAVAPGLNFVARYNGADKIAQAVSLAPDYIVARAELSRAEAGGDLARATRLPSLRLQAQLRTDLERGSTNSSIGLAAGVDLGMGGLSGRQVQAARLEIEGRKSNLAAVERNLTNGVLTARDRITILRTREDSQQRQLAQTDTVMQSYEQQFIAGQRELLDLLTTGRDQYDAKFDYIETMIERKRTEYAAAHDLAVLGTMINAK